MNVNQFLQNVRRIAESRPAYRTGGNGSDGTCDCIGLIMGALGGKFDLHSSNYFARFRMRGLYGLQDESQLHEGSIVYKSRRDTAQLNARYQEGGTHDTGDLLDYYHVGVVTGVDPLEITHCTSDGTVDGITYDGNIAAWSWFGDLLDVEYTEDYEPEEMQPETALAGLAVVHTEDGNPVKLRSTPSTRLPYIAKVPNGAQVEVLESAGEWSTVRWNGQRGYMMTEYLRVAGRKSGPQAMSERDVTIQVSESAARALYRALGGALQ